MYLFYNVAPCQLPLHRSESSLTANQTTVQGLDKTQLDYNFLGNLRLELSGKP